MLPPSANLAVFTAALPDEIHPAGRVTIDAWLGQGQRALEAGNNAEASRLQRNVNDKVALELGWYAEAMAAVK